MAENLDATPAEYPSGDDAARKTGCDNSLIRPDHATRLAWQGKVYGCRDGESVLEASLRQGVDLPFSCRSGSCHACLQRAVSGVLPEGAQKGLKANLAAKNYFLSCLCRPERDLEFAPPSPDDLYFMAIVVAKEQLARDIVRIRLEPSLETDYRSGQFINIRHPDGEVRSYSLASVPGEDFFLELHVKRVPGGAVSNWLIDKLAVNDEIEIQGPNGTCVHSHNSPARNMLLVGTGTGLAPLIGIIRTALASGHEGQIHLYHGSSREDGLYLTGELRNLAALTPNFHYVPCVSRHPTAPGLRQGRAHDLAFAEHRELAGWDIYLAGNADMVAAAKAMAAKAGAAAGDIRADPFQVQSVPAPSCPVADSDGPNGNSGSRRFPPDPEMWAALEEGKVMNVILTDFYTRVFDDPILSPYFQGVTKQRLIEKVYSFMRQIFTGEKRYFGNRPRNAHHWMVIPDEVFDHRERLMTACMREHGLAEHLVVRWRAIEESFRGDIVKARPFNRVVDGVEIPAEGFGPMTLDVGALCDGCDRVLDPGEKVLCHLRLGTIYCSTCRRE